MNHPLKGQSLTTFYFKESEKEQVMNFFHKINSILQEAGMSLMPFDNVQENLNSCLIEALPRLMEIKSLNTEMGLASPKVELSKEFLQMKEIVGLVPELIRRVGGIKQKLELDLKTRSAQLIEEILRSANNAAFTYSKERKQILISASEDYLNFADFKPVIEEVFGIHSRVQDMLGYENKYSQELQNTFKIVKQKVLMNKVKINDLVKKVNSNIINVETLKEIDPIAYEYLKTEAFQKFCNDFSLNAGDRNSYNALVKPKERLGEIFKLTNQEVMVFSAALDPIKSFKTQVGQPLKSKSIFGDFYVSDDQKTFKHEVKVFYANVDQPIQLIIPVYFSYVKANMNPPPKIQKVF